MHLDNWESVLALNHMNIPGVDVHDYMIRFENQNVTIKCDIKKNALLKTDSEMLSLHWRSSRDHTANNHK